MAVFFTGSELLGVAVGIEKNGAAFYQALADKSENKDVKAIYDYLVSEEKKHQNTFQGMLDTIGEYKPPEDYPGEYKLYIQSLIESSVFLNITDAKQRAAKISSEMEALKTGIQAEKDSILFYIEMQNLVRESDRKVMHDIINEEKNHLRQLHELEDVIRKQKGQVL